MSSLSKSLLNAPLQFKLRPTAPTCQKEMTSLHHLSQAGSDRPAPEVDNLDTPEGRHSGWL